MGHTFFPKRRVQQYLWLATSAEVEVVPSGMASRAIEVGWTGAKLGWASARLLTMFAMVLEGARALGGARAPLAPISRSFPAKELSESFSPRPRFASPPSRR